MEKTKFISILAIGLLLSNLVLVGFIVMNKPQQLLPPPPQHEGPRNTIIERLHFDEKQVVEYDKMIEWHRTNIRETDQKIADLKKQLYSTLNSLDNTNVKDSLIAAIAIAHQVVEHIHYKHFEDIKQLCNSDEQKAAFEELTKEIAALFAPHRPPHKQR